jgi:hypothetical protein
MNENNQLPPNDWNTPVLESRNNIKRVNKCGFCGELQHNKRTCQLFREQREYFLRKFCVA